MNFFINKNFLFLLTWLMTLRLAFSEPFKDLNTDFLEEKNNKKKSTKKISGKQKSKSKSFDEVIKGFQKIEGLFTIYWNSNKNKAYIEILPEQFETI